MQRSYHSMSVMSALTSEKKILKKKFQSKSIESALKKHVQEKHIYIQKV